MWAAYFQNSYASIIGMDINVRAVNEDPRIEIIEHDATMPFPGLEDFDLIIDDGSHEPHDQVEAFAWLWHRVKRGGVYVIEDVRPDAVEQLRKVHPFDVIDMRPIKGRWDDILLVAHL